MRDLHNSPIIRRLPISAEVRRTLRHSRVPCATFASLAMLARRGSLYFATTKSCTLKLLWRIVTSAAILLRPAHSLRRPMALCCIVPVDLPQSCLMAWNFQEPDKCTRPRMVLAPRSQCRELSSSAAEPQHDRVGDYNQDHLALLFSVHHSGSYVAAVLTRGVSSSF